MYPSFSTHSVYKLIRYHFLFALHISDKLLPPTIWIKSYRLSNYGSFQGILFQTKGFKIINLYFLHFVLKFCRCLPTINFFHPLTSYPSLWVCQNWSFRYLTLPGRWPGFIASSKRRAATPKLSEDRRVLVLFILTGWTANQEKAPTTLPSGRSKRSCTMVLSTLWANLNKRITNFH